MARDFRPAATRIARSHGIPVGLFSALISQESGWNPKARSPVGAIGLGQLMPGTARGLGVNPHDPIQNLQGAAKYLSQAKAHFGTWQKALAAYNAGWGAVSKYGGIPPYHETQNYVKSIMAHSSLSTGAQPGIPGLSTMMTAGSATGGRRRGPNLQARQDRMLASLQPSAFLHNILQRSVGERVADVVNQPITLPPLPKQRGDTSLPTLSWQAGLTAPTGATPKNWRKFVAMAPNADRRGVRTSPSVLEFVGALGKTAGRRLIIGTGTNHNRLTVNGRVSDHWAGHAADIPAAGAKLRQLGYLALIRAGMPRAQAARARKTGGLFNVGPYQIIFATDEGGNHFNHLHVGVRR